MNQATRDHRHDHNDPGGNPPGWKRHSKWFVLAVVLMLVCMVIYIMTMDEAVPPGALPEEGGNIPVEQSDVP